MPISFNNSEQKAEWGSLYPTVLEATPKIKDIAQEELFSACKLFYNGNIPLFFRDLMIICEEMEEAEEEGEDYKSALLFKLWVADATKLLNIKTDLCY
jgi:hypothetical protein